jgi:hypothetical protein
MKPDQIDILAFTVLGHFEQIDDAQETGFDRQLMMDVIERDLLDGIDLDLTFLHRVALADLDLGAHPDANATGDGPAPYTLAKAFGEKHLGCC